MKEFAHVNLTFSQFSNIGISASDEISWMNTENKKVLNICLENIHFKLKISLISNYKVVDGNNLDITNIKLELLYDALEEDEYEKLFDEYMNIDYKKLNAACKKHNINYYKTNRIQKQRLLTNLNNDNLINLMKNERRLNIILDNARIHTSKVVEMACDILNINLVFLPPYCPFLNPIENVWKDVKREIYNSYYTNLDELIEVFEDAFMSRVYSRTYYENWLEKFFA